MNYDFRGRLALGANHLGLKIENDSMAALEIYFIELKKWGRRVNLIAKSSSDEHIVENHFIDSLTILPLLTGPDAHLLDVGTGAGFPGLVCKIVMPELRVTLVEPRQKRVSFLRHMVRTLGLKDITVLDCRIEDEERLPSASSFSHITSRAVSEIKVFMAMVQRFAAGGAQVICMKGPKWRGEVAEAGEVIGKGYVQQDVVELSLPFSGAGRVLLVYAPRNETKKQKHNKNIQNKVEK